MIQALLYLTAGLAGLLSLFNTFLIILMSSEPLQNMIAQHIVNGIAQGANLYRGVVYHLNPKISSDVYFIIRSDDPMQVWYGSTDLDVHEAFELS